MKVFSILIADEDQYMAETVAEILSQEADEIDITRSGKETIEVISTKKYSLALIDVRLPDCDGVELMRKIKERAPDTDIVILTKNASVHSAIAALNHGASRYLLKPCAPDELLSVVRDIYKRKVLEENNRLYLRRLEVQNSLSQAILSALRPEEVSKTVVESLRGLTEAEISAVLVKVDGEGGETLEPLAFSGMDRETAKALSASKEVEQYLAFGASEMSGTVMLGGLGLGDKKCPISLYRLRGRSKDLGVLAVAQSCMEMGDESQEELMRSIANWVGVALERAMLYQQLERAYSDLKNAQKRLIQTEKHAAIGRLSAGLAHEIGTPLNIISGRAEYLLELAKDDPKTSKVLKVIVEQIERISRLIRQLLDFAREYATSRNKVDLSQVINAVISLLEGPLKKNKIDLIVRLPQDLPMVIANFNQMQQVFINLLMNSIDAIASDPGHCREKGRGKIIITAQYIPRIHKVEVAVIDNGCGIKEEDIDKVFEPFFSTKEVGTGTGLGLAVVYGIITEHGGNIEIDSKYLEGTTVRFTLQYE